MKIREAENYILGIPKFTKKNPTEHTREFMRRLGEPWKDMKVVHIAGTNGKGSVCSYLQALLLAEGKRTGLFTSPHLVRISERIQINGQEIDDNTFLQGFEEVMNTVEEMNKDGIAHPTFFEFLFGMAMVIFREKKVDYCILEAGLGGRTDTTNVIPKPELAIITSIGLDHTEFLGETIEEIAWQKAGIIKPDVPLVFDGHEEKGRKVIMDTAKNMGISCRKITENAYEIREMGQKSIAFSLSSAYYDNTVWTLHTPAKYQVRNASLALNAMEILMNGIRPANLEQWQKALYETCWPGRMEEIAERVYFDGAHNIPGIQAFAETAVRMEGSPKILLFSAVADKKHREMTDYLCRSIQPDLVIVTKIHNGRAEDTGTLKKEFEESTKKKIIVIENLQEAYQFALDARGEDGILFCLGSLYLIGDLKEYLQV